jgi:hypothetical protein
MQFIWSGFEMGFIYVMGLKNADWLQLSKEICGREIQQTATRYWEGYSLDKIIKNVLNFDNKQADCYKILRGV